MSDYFKNFPVVNYNFGDEKTSTEFQHIGTAVDILEQVRPFNVYYQNYVIQNGERPEQLSYKLYGHTNHYWTFYLLNDHLRTQGWPIRESDLYNKAQQYYPNMTFSTIGVTQLHEPKLIDLGEGEFIEWLPTDSRTPLSQSPGFKVGSYVYFRYSKKAGVIKKIDQQTAMITVDVEGVRTVDNVMEIIEEEEALKVIADPEHTPNKKIEELEIFKHYDEFDAPHHYEDASGNWLYPVQSAIYPYEFDQSKLRRWDNLAMLDEVTPNPTFRTWVVASEKTSLNSISNYTRLRELNESQQHISVIKADVIDQIVSELKALLKRA
jgi:hypothetical protein